MCPENARVFVVEDLDDWQQGIKETLETGGHSVVGSAQALEEALEKIPLLEGQGVQVAIIDGNLTEGDTSGSDGQTILEAIHAHAPNVKTIGLSSLPIPGVDVNVGKTRFGNLESAVREI